MSLTNVFDVAASALTAQSQRLNVVASNLANADSATGADGNPYQARQVVFQAVAAGGSASGTTVGVRVAAVILDPSPMRRIHDPKHPLADADGYVTMPNVNVVEEMVNMIAASRAYQNNVEVMNTAKTLMLRTLTLGQ
jgi:flagellar basal-body rod protein FlgC